MDQGWKVEFGDRETSMGTASVTGGWITELKLWQWIIAMKV